MAAVGDSNSPFRIVMCARSSPPSHFDKQYSVQQFSLLSVRAYFTNGELISRVL